MKDPQPIWYPWQRAARTILQALIVLVPVVNGLAAATSAYLTEQTHVPVDPVVFVWLNAIIAVTALVMGLISRLMAVPGVNTILSKVGLGSVPKSALTPEGDR